MKPLRILGIVFGIFLALVAVGIGTLYALFDGEKIKSELSAAMLDKHQRKLDIAGKLELSVWPDVGIRLGRVTLSEPGGKAEFFALDSARVAVAVMPLLSKQVQLRRVEVNGFKVILVKHKDGTLNIADLLNGTAGHGKKTEESQKVGDGDTAREPLQIDIAGIKVANAQFTWRDEKSGSTTAFSNINLGTGRVQADGAKQTVAVDAVSLAVKGKSGADAFDLTLDLPKLSLAPGKAAGDSLTLSASLTGSGRSVVAKLLLSGVEGTAETLKIGKLTLDADAKAADTVVKTHIESPVAANLKQQTVTLEKLGGSADISNPQLPMKQLKLPLSGSLRVDLAKQFAALNLGTQFDESKIVAKLDVVKFSPLALGFDLDIDTLNVDKYLPPKAADAPPAKDDKVDFSALKGHTASGAIRIGALQVSKLKLAKLNAKIKLAGGRLDVSPLTMNLYEGTASGGLTLNAAGNGLALKQNLSAININPLMKDLADKDLLEGRGNVVLDVTSHGDSVTAMKKALAGSASLTLKNGAIKGINLAQSLRDLKGKLGAVSAKREDATQQAKAGDKTDFSELSASLKIAGGVAHNSDLAMKSPFLRLSGEGDIDIGNGRMYYVTKASVVNTSAGQGGKELEHLKGLTVPVRVSGPFESLSYKIEFASLVSDAAKAKVEEKKQEIKTKVEDKLKDKLKGLFGR
ncbi:MAG: AsmA family protein [Sulfuritalea sp.]|nr:AsmA family protein [Sulfuritalea sp.]